jgi:hypothetical protein
LKKSFSEKGSFFVGYLFPFRVLTVKRAIMKQKNSFLLSLLFLIFSGSTAVAQKEICACASYSSLQFQTDYEDIFPHELIKSKNIKQAIIYTTGHSSNSPNNQLFSKYTELKFNFDNEGYVASRISYYLGSANHIDEFERNLAGRVTKQTFTYLDSLEQKINGFPVNVIDFTYDKNGRLILRKNRDSKGNILDNAKASYTQYEYDTNDKLISETTQFYYEYSIAYNSRDITRYTYANDNRLRIAKTTGGSYGKSVLIDSVIYNKENKLSSDKTYYSGSALSTFEKTYTYGREGKLITFSMKTAQQGGSECPGGGNYTDHYFYTSDGFVERITNSFGIYTCEMKFEYLK